MFGYILIDRSLRLRAARTDDDDSQGRLVEEMERAPPGTSRWQAKQCNQARMDRPPGHVHVHVEEGEGETHTRGKNWIGVRR
jgi:hypothetical protein